MIKNQELQADRKFFAVPKPVDQNVVPQGETNTVV